MRHLSEDSRYELAKKVVYESDLSEKDVWDMRHISVCEECYRSLRSMMLVLQTADNIDLVTFAGRQETATVIRVVVLDAKTLLEQLSGTALRFAAGASMGALRSAGETEDTEVVLESVTDPQTFVAYDRQSRTLTLQLANVGEKPPKAFLALPDGSRRELALQRIDGCYLAQVTDLEEGEYRLILEN